MEPHLGMYENFGQRAVEGPTASNPPIPTALRDETGRPVFTVNDDFQIVPTRDRSELHSALLSRPCATITLRFFRPLLKTGSGASFTTHASLATTRELSADLESRSRGVA
jgi:hypothetical protein